MAGKPSLTTQLAVKKSTGNLTPGAPLKENTASYVICLAFDVVVADDVLIGGLGGEGGRLGVLVSLVR